MGSDGEQLGDGTLIPRSHQGVLKKEIRLIPSTCTSALNIFFLHCTTAQKHLTAATSRLAHTGLLKLQVEVFYVTKSL